ncbi:MAG: TlpA family protein disulfide reductase [Deltaproteobacteria bacterium]|nr:TlpA family protein disulfide reductase [Kofleriaceae bacterium]
MRAAPLLVMLAACDVAGSGRATAPPKPPPAPASSPSSSATRVAIGPDAETIDATTLVGKPAPAWDVDWMGGAPIAIEELRGGGVLVRWFTEGCPYCAATAPTLVKLHDELGDRGLRVIGMYHHKSDEPLEPARVRALAERFGFRFPVAIDHDWKTLRRWWLDDHEGWTSISFLVDRKGVVRFVHTGGSYAPDSADALQMRRWIDQLLAEP